MPFLRKMMAYLIFLSVLASADIVHGQRGFLSIACGMAKGSNYTDKTTGISYISDAPYIDTGKTYNISNQLKSGSISKQYWTLRSFPDGNRNCYTLKPVIQGNKYLIRALFLYGSYDGQFSNPQFDLYLGVNKWSTVSITSADNVFEYELIANATADNLPICLVKTGFDDPFITAIELRRLKRTMYTVVNESNSLSKFDRVNLGTSDTIIRFPNDTYDRRWRNLTFTDWSNLNTSLRLKTPKRDEFEVPLVVMSTAVQPSGMNDPSILLKWESSLVNQSFYVCLHFAELVRKQSRTFSVFLNAVYQGGPYRPLYLLATHAIVQFPAQKQQFLSLNATQNSTLPPLLNAIEIFYFVDVSKQGTDTEDVDGIMGIKSLYQLKRDWQGDPCAPINFTWEGLGCIFSGPNPRIISLNLSSSQLTGNIPNSIAKLKALESLDLSNNSLTGPIPEFLASLSSLRLLNLRGNNLIGPVPPALLQRSKDGSLTLSDDFGTNDHKKTTASDVIEIAAIPTVLVLVVAVLACKSRKRKPSVAVTSTTYLPGQAPVKPPTAPVKTFSKQFQQDKWIFTYAELEDITSKFDKVIGKGGFGTVFHGDLGDGTKVAVKLRSQLSSRGTKEFEAEARLLAPVYHKNLVPLIGYCVDNIHLGLVYEYMAKGSLREQLIGKTADAKALTWIERLQIAVNAAQGLEYLHNRCKPAIIHGDVKTSNILLNNNVEAKIADFGISKAFLQNSRTHSSTAFVGTPGYLDPEYYNTYKLNEKSDIYSFGVVLLELITGQCAITEKVHITKWVKQRIARGEIDDIADAKLEGDYDTHSLWRVADLALKCASPASAPRPGISEVMVLLRECLELELDREKAHNLYPEFLF